MLETEFLLLKHNIFTDLLSDLSRMFGSYEFQVHLDPADLMIRAWICFCLSPLVSNIVFYLVETFFLRLGFCGHRDVHSKLLLVSNIKMKN